MNKELLKIGRNYLLTGKLPAADVCRELILLLGDVLNLAPPGMNATPIAPLPPKGNKQRLALCLGHGRSGDEGAVAADKKTSEEEYNLSIIRSVAATLRGWGFDVLEITYYQGNGYTAAMQWLAKTLLDKGATAAVEFHFNAATGTAKGHEFLHWENSKVGVTLARELLAGFDSAFPGHSRGLKPKDGSDRGALFLSLTHCPACIAEPFFGDNFEEWAVFGTDEGKEKLITLYSHALAAWMERQAA